MKHAIASAGRRGSRIAAAVLALLMHACAAAEPLANLPPEIGAALTRARIPREALSVVVREVDAGADAGLAWRADASVNPASLMKLVTTYAALDLLGPSWTWTTGIWLQGRLRDPGPRGVLEGDLVIKGSGDPKLVLERVWLLLRQVRAAGVREIRGDIVLDRSAFAVVPQSPADFDGEPLRPYNAQPDALLLNFRSLQLGFVPDAARGVARVTADPALQGVRVEPEVALTAGRCDDWRAGLKIDVSDPLRLRFGGTFAAACGERQWPIAFADPASYDARMIEALWRETGGALGGVVRDGRAPQGVAPNLEFASPSLAEVVRDINKYSNNLMAQQLFLTLGLQFRGSGSREAALDQLRPWLRAQLGALADAVDIDNGSGLSRAARLNAAALALLLQRAWASAVMPEFIASLPIAGADGTQRRAPVPRDAGRAHLKTGSLRDVAAVAGYLFTPGGRRFVLVAIVNHPQAGAARPALDALVDWAMSARGQAALRP